MWLDYLSISLALAIPVTIIFSFLKDGVFQESASDFDDASSAGDMNFSSHINTNTGFIEYEESSKSAK